MLVPELRFKEFYDNWSSNKLIEICEFSKGNLLSKADLSDNGIYECILYGELYTKYSEIIKNIYSKTNINNKNLIYSKCNDVIIPASGETALDISRASCILKDNVILGGDLNILTPFNNMDGRFLSYVISNNKKNEIAKVAQGNSVVHLYANKIKNIEIEFPTFKEQVKIANTLELLDKKIELQINKIEALKLYKKGLMNQIFSEKSLNVNKFKDLIELKGKTKHFSSIGKDYGKYRFFTNSPSIRYSDEYDVDDEVILANTGGTANFQYFNGKCSYMSDNYVFKSKENTLFLFYYLQYKINFINKLGFSGSGLKHLSKSWLDKLSIPSVTIEKQKFISMILHKLDEKIILESSKSQSLNNLKKGLLQQMFV